MGLAYCSAYVRTHCFRKWLAPLAKRSACCVAGQPTGQQEVDDEVNSEVADVDSKVAGEFIMILNIADEVTVLTEAPTFPISQRAWPTAYFTSNYCFGLPFAQRAERTAYKTSIDLANCLLGKAVNVMCSSSIIFIFQRD
jgi:hypothetical protein